MIGEYEGMIELQRNELAEYFNCAPSQINYVLATRFSPQKGYVTESKRGGGGYIKVTRVRMERKGTLVQALRERLTQGKIGEREANELIRGLESSGAIDEGQRRLMAAAVSNKALRIPATVKDQIRASILQEMITTLLEEGV